jgi:hypothetical protein
VVLDESVEDLRLLAVIVVLRDGHPHLGLTREWSRLAHDGEAIAVLVGQRLQQHPVDDAEDGRVGADAETEGRDGQSGIPGSLHQRSGAVADILKQLVKPAHRGGSGLLGGLSMVRNGTGMSYGVDCSVTSHYYFRGAGEDSAVNGRPHRCGLFF